jgi:hypothetical protein
VVFEPTLPEGCSVGTSSVEPEEESPSLLGVVAQHLGRTTASLPLAASDVTIRNEGCGGVGFVALPGVKDAAGELVRDGEMEAASCPTTV